ncbi:acyl-CoA dehydrogenase [Actinomycetospora sp. C-140]
MRKTVDFSPGTDAEYLRDVVRELLRKHSDEAAVRRLMDTDQAFDPEVWMLLAELGLQGLTIAEEHGGAGATAIELGVVFEELGRALFCGPFLATVALAVPALQELGDVEACARLLPDIATGRSIATLAWAGDHPARSTLRVTDDEDPAITGTAGIVVDGALADTILVAATSDAGVSLFEVPGDAPGLTRTPLTALDQTRALAELRFDAVPARRLGPTAGAADCLIRSHRVSALLLAAEQLGGAERVLELAVEHASNRVQFGRAIGSFQAVKHRLVDMLVGVESTRSAVYHGLWTAAHDPSGLAVSAPLARSVASEAFRRATTDTIQVFGGIGFTWEHPAHLYLKRASSSRLLLGAPARHRAELLGLVTTDHPSAAGDDVSAHPAPADPTPDGAVTAFLHRHTVPDPDDRVADRAFREARFDAGLAVIGFDEGHGGRGSDQSMQAAVEECFVAAGAADHSAANIVGLGMAMPTIHTHGTAEQRRRYLRPCFSGEEIWCQLFSEPGAGSDLAALATRAVRDGDDFVVNGQKIWTSLGHVADFGILLARTDPDVPKHRGLTYFLLDMRSPGVEVRPLRQLTGESEFNEVYLTDVRVPAHDVLGSVDDGWRVAMTTLANERVSIGRQVAARGSGPIAHAVELYRAAVTHGRADAATTDRLGQLWTQAEAVRLTNVRAAARYRDPGPEGSIAKLQMAELNKAVYEFCVDLSGDAGLLIDGYEQSTSDVSSVHGGTDVRKSYLRSLANSIEGGTSEILRNILGERVLGLPGEPRGDRDVSWRTTRRS